MASALAGVAAPQHNGPVRLNSCPLFLAPPPLPRLHAPIPQDYSLTLLGGPTEQQLLEQRAAEYAAAEAMRRALLAQAEVALWEHVQLAAAEAAAEARVAFK